MEEADLKASLDMLLMNPKAEAAPPDLPVGMMVDTLELPF